MKNSGFLNLKLLLFCLANCLLLSCGSQKDTAMSRGMQNLTARYNYIYNSNVILDNYEESLYQNYEDNYTDILPVYTTPEKFNPSAPAQSPPNEGELDAIIEKSRTIIGEKSFSNYIDESYLLIGKTNYFKANYFIAQEYFDYTAKTYAGNMAVQMASLNWKARSLMQLNNLDEAALILDTVYQNLSRLKKHRSEPMATIAQMYIYQDKLTEATSMLENAVKEADLKRNRIRWTYILAQLYEKQKNYPLALEKYTRVQKSNAAFELYFNANLNRIKINGLLNGEKINRKKQLLILLKDDKNLDYNDQIYYQVAESYAADGDYTQAEKYYQLSVKNSTRNKYQKGLSYLRIADLNFKQLRNFLKAKVYYDSTVSTLPKNYPAYPQILKKSQNLEYLTKRYELISLQDTLQMLASLPEKERRDKVNSLLTIASQHRISTQEITAAPTVPFNNIDPQPADQGAFYFSNSTAISRGYTDFIKKWGNRPKEDNWRQSIKSSAQTTEENIAKAQDPILNPSLKDTLRTDVSQEDVNAYLNAVPLSPDSMMASHQKIIDAYYEMANFYQQELNDREEAIRIYQLMLARYPANNRLASIYYSLYLGYQDIDTTKQNQYKNLVLNQFPNSTYAKIIKDPNYSTKQSELQALVLQQYNNLFGKYERKLYPEVVTAANMMTGTYPDNELNPQAAYLKAIAIGRMQPVDNLIAAFREITRLYEGDRLIVPLVQEHLSYIAAHMDEFSKRKIALPDFDDNEPRFFVPITLPEKKISNPLSTIVKPEIIGMTTATKIPEKLNTPETTISPESPANPSKIFSTAISLTYYFVIDVADASLTLTSSRFGIGQYNRGNYTNQGLKHRLVEFDNDQMIYIGNFSSFAEAKSYADGINPYLKQIMKVPSGIYTTFIISKENFEKLQSKDVINQYLEFFNNNYSK
ncbi:tetratricopeptide repeat protein [Pedobacter sp. AW31-3R]|uniref:type IX secretion system periplasmic lipoprotein PorW/SprE n=1 Tax=Pedobacter sp. AW31-3R TaxID=3445781 RepID=UPI003FA04DC6